jgi:hypothetical protein
MLPALCAAAGAAAKDEQVNETNETPKAYFLPQFRRAGIVVTLAKTVE